MSFFTRTEHKSLPDGQMFPQFSHNRVKRVAIINAISDDFVMALIFHDDWCQYGAFSAFQTLLLAIVSTNWKISDYCHCESTRNAAHSANVKCSKWKSSYTRHTRRMMRFLTHPKITPVWNILTEVQRKNHELRKKRYGANNGVYWEAHALNIWSVMWKYMLVICLLWL